MRTFLLIVGVVLVAATTFLYRGTLAARSNTEPADSRRPVAPEAPVPAEAPDAGELVPELNLDELARGLPLLPEKLFDGPEPAGIPVEIPAGDEVPMELKALNAFVFDFVLSTIEDEEFANDERLEHGMPVLDKAKAAEILQAIREETDQEVQFQKKRLDRLQRLSQWLDSAEAVHLTSDSEIDERFALVNMMALAEAMHKVISSQRAVGRIPPLERREYLQVVP